MVKITLSVVTAEKHEYDLVANKSSVCCGRIGHVSTESPLLGCVCIYCGKQNHIASGCRTRENYPHGKTKQFHKKYNKGYNHNYVGTYVATNCQLKSNCTDKHLDGVANLFEIKTIDPSYK